MNKNDYRLEIYKAMIQYLLESTSYTLSDIAELSDSSIKNIQSIYCNDLMPADFSSESHLIKLYHFVLELKINEKRFY